jgi:type I restriction enzyme S subunit
MNRGIQYPDSWQRTTFGEVAHYVNGYAFRPDDWGKVGLPIIRIAQINDPEADHDYYDGAIADDYRIEDGDLLFSWSATLTTLVWNRGPALLNQHIFKVIPQEGIGLHFLHHLIDYKLDALARQSHGSTMKHIKKSDLLPFSLVLPPYSEQRRIAEILDAADEAIRQTKRVIAKLREVKRGLLHDLLTRGLDADGNLRDPIAHPEQFKDSSLGRIPREWSVEEGSDITELITKGASPRWQGFEYQPEGVLFVTSENVREGYLDVSDPKFISDEFDRKLQRSHLEAGDVLVNLVGASIGRSCIYSGQFGSANINQAVCTFRTKPGVLPNWILSYLQMPETISRLLEDQVETARANISLGQLGEFLFPLPSLSEQHRVAAILDTHEARIRAEEAVLAERRQVKRGLMEDLLTGRVRV